MISNLRTLASCCASLLVCLLVNQVVCFGQEHPIEAFGRACLPVLVPNELRITHGDDYSAAFREAICGNYYRSHQQEVEAQGGLNVIEVFEIGGGGGQKTITVSRDSFCRNTNYQVAHSYLYKFWSKIVPDQARTEFVNCMNLYKGDNKRAMPLQLTATEVKNQVVVQVKWDANAGGQPAIDRVEPVGLIPASVPAKGTRVTNKGDGLTMRFTWANACDDLGIVIVHAKIKKEAYEQSIPVKRKRDVIGTAAVSLTQMVKTQIESKTIGSETIYTDNLHKKYCKKLNIQRCPECIGAKKEWCATRKSFILEKTTPLGVLKNPRLVQVEEDPKAGNWNDLSNKAYWRISKENDTIIEFTRPFGGKKFGVKLYATELVYELKPLTTEVEKHSLTAGYTFVVDVPAGQQGVITIQKGNNKLVLPAGDSNAAHLRLLHKAPKGTGTAYTYQVPTSCP